MGMKLGLLDVLRLCAVLVKKLLSWLLLVTCVCEVILHYLLLIIDWIVRETEEHQQLTGKDVKLETPEDTADDGDDELQYPVSCESASEDEQVITSALTVKQKLKWSEECCSEADDPQDLVMTVAKIPDCYREQILQDKASSKDIQEDASIVVDSCDESEDEEDSKADCLNYSEEDEKFEFYGAVPDNSSNMKSDQGSKDEVIITAEQSQSVIKSDSSFVPCAGIAGGGDQQCVGEEANDDRRKQQTTVPPDATCEQPPTATGQVQRDTPQDRNHGNCGETLPNNTPND